MFTSQGQAKRFFVDKIAAQAVTDGTPLSDAERQMLSFSESDPEFAVDPALVQKLRAEISDEDYEAKILRVAGRVVRYMPRGRSVRLLNLVQSANGEIRLPLLDVGAD